MPLGACVIRHQTRSSCYSEAVIVKAFIVSSYSESSYSEAVIVSSYSESSYSESIYSE